MEMTYIRTMRLAQPPSVSLQRPRRPAPGPGLPSIAASFRSRFLPSKYFAPGRERCSPCNGKTHYFDLKNDPDRSRPLSDRFFRTNTMAICSTGASSAVSSQKDYDALD